MGEHKGEETSPTPPKALREQSFQAINDQEKPKPIVIVPVVTTAPRKMQRIIGEPVTRSKGDGCYVHNDNRRSKEWLRFTQSLSKRQKD